MKTCKVLAILISLTALAGQQAVVQESRNSKDQLVREYVDAFNNRQIDAMLSMVTADIEWLSVAGNKIAIETTGKDELQKGMAGYFKAVPTARSELLWTKSSPSRVAALENATWKSRSGMQSQVSLAVYEFRDDLISRVYYYPAEKPLKDRKKL